MRSIKRNKSGFKISLGILILISGLLAASFVYAYIAAQTESNTLTPEVNAIKQDLGDNLTGTLDNLQIKIKATSTDPQIYIFDNTSSTFRFFTNCGSFSGDGIFNYATSTCAAESPAAFLKDFNFIEGRDYSIQLYFANGNAQVYGVDYNNYSGGDCVAYCNGLTDLYFAIGNAPTNSIQFDFPTNGTTTPDFIYWNFSGFSLEAPAVILVNTGATTTGLTHITNILDSAGSFEINAAKTYILPQGINYALARLAVCPAPYNLYSDCIPSTWAEPYGLGFFETIATSSLISFTITGEIPYSGGNYGTYYPTSTPTSTATSSEWVITCDPNDPLFTRSICQISKWVLDGIVGILKFLFIPSSESLSNFVGLGDIIKNKAPIGYFYSIKSALNNVAATSSLAFDLATSTAALAPVLTPIKTGITFILWFVFCFWIFNRIRKLEL